MSLLRWMSLGAQSPASAASSPKNAADAAPAPLPDDPAPAARCDSKRFGMENFGNTCYANSVLQALYFCEPFRQLLCDAPDRSYPTGPLVFTTPPPTQPSTALAPQNSKKPAHARRSSTDPRDPLTLFHPSYANTGPPALTATSLMPPAGGAPQKPTSNPAPAPIFNIGPVIPSLPPSLFSALRSLFIHIAANPADKGTVSPRAFVEKLKKENELFRSNMHQDAHEFLNYLLNSVVEDLTEEMKAAPLEDSPKSVPSGDLSVSPHLTLVHDLFEGTLTSETRCLTCETVSSRDESFLDLSIDIERNSSVTACLRQFSASEMLCQKNKFFCDSCCGLQEAEKRMKIKRLPNVLALHLKRFKYQEDVQRYTKLSYRVAFPLELRLFNTVDEEEDPDRLYELFAIIVHVGSGPNHGHYITIAKQGDQWLLFDDDIVETIRESEIPKYFGDSPAGSGYVLFYQAVHINPQTLGAKTPSVLQTSAVVQQQVVLPTEAEASEVKSRGSPNLSEPGTSSTPTLSHPPSSPIFSKVDPPSTAPSSYDGTGLKQPVQSSVKTPLDGSISGSTKQAPSPNGTTNGDLALTPTKSGKAKDLNGGWFRWGGKKKNRDASVPPRKATLDDHQAPVIDIRRPSAPANLGPSSESPREHGSPQLRGEHDKTPIPVFGLGVDIGTSSRMTEEPVSTSVSANSSGDHLLRAGTPPQPAHHLHPHDLPQPVGAHVSPARGSRSGSVSATTNGSASGSTSGLHVPSYQQSTRASQSASSSASSVSTPLRSNASAPKLNAPPGLTMSPVKKTRKRPSTASSARSDAFPEDEDPPPPLPTRLGIPFQSPMPGQPMGFPDIPPMPAVGAENKIAKRKLSFSSALGSIGRVKDRSLGKMGHNRRISIAEGAGAMPQLVPNSPLKRK